MNEILKNLLAALSQLFSRDLVYVRKIPSEPEQVKDVEPVPIILTPTHVTPIVSQSKAFLICPIQAEDNGKPVTPFTVKISAILDHSGTALDPNWQSVSKWGKNAKNQRVEAFNGEVGCGPQCPVEPCGYPNDESAEFFKNKEINYVGVSSDGGKKILQYDGHAGYDFAYPVSTPIVAPADGTLHKAIVGVDKIYSGMWGEQAGNFKLDNSFYIKHPNDYVTWFRHCARLHDDIENEIGTDLSKFCNVRRGQVIAYLGKVGTVGAHLHFEVRDPNGNIVDPYGDKLWV